MAQRGTPGVRNDAGFPRGTARVGSMALLRFQCETLRVPSPLPLHPLYKRSRVETKSLSVLTLAPALVLQPLEPPTSIVAPPHTVDCFQDFQVTPMLFPTLLFLSKFSTPIGPSSAPQVLNRNSNKAPQSLSMRGPPPRPPAMAVFRYGQAVTQS